MTRPPASPALRGPWPLAAALLTACGASTLTTLEPSPADSASMLAAPAPTPATSTPDPAASASASPAASPAASASASAPPAPPAATRLQIEPVYLAAAYPYPTGSAERRERLVELERWNNGGLGESERWHAQPRVVIGEPVAGRSKADTKTLMRHLRAEHYGTVRRCYDAALRHEPELGGRVVIRITIGKSGTITAASSQGGRGVPDQRKHRTALGSAEVGRCIASGLRGAHLPGARGGATVSFSVDVYPGDAPLPEPDSRSSPSRLDLEAADRVARGLAAPLEACFVAGLTAHPGLWGRLALRLDLGANGAVTDGREVDSTFPSTTVRDCALDVVRAARWPTPQGDQARVVVALRWPP